MMDPTTLYPDWNTPEHAYHNTRVIADQMGMTLEQKNQLCECIYQESGFHIGAIGKPNHNGTIDYGLCQYNNGKIRGTALWIGLGAEFANIEEVLTNPEKNVRVMIRTVLAGHWNWWSSYSTGTYKQWAAANSPMWALAT